MSCRGLVNVMKTFFSNFESWNCLYKSVLVPLKSLSSCNVLFIIDETKKCNCQGTGSLFLMFLLHCFAFKRPAEPWRSRGPHDLTSFPPCDSSKRLFFPPSPKTYMFILENVFLTKFQTCKKIPGCEREVNLQLKPSLAGDLALNIRTHSVMKMKPVDCRGTTSTNVSGIKMCWRAARPPCCLLTICITNPRECHGSK